MWSSHTMKYYLSIKKNGVLMYATTWMNESFKHYAKGKQPETKVIYCIIVWLHLYEMS